MTRPVAAMSVREVEKYRESYKRSYRSMTGEQRKERNEYMKNWRKLRGQEGKKKDNLKGYAWRYGISKDAYTEIISRGCAAVAFGASGCSGPIGLDHDHQCCKGPRSCGKCIRGALCFTHNVAEGHYDRAKSWVESYRAEKK